MNSKETNLMEAVRKAVSEADAVLMASLEEIRQEDKARKIERIKKSLDDKVV